MPPPSFRIVIVLYNHARWIGPCLEALRASDYPAFGATVLDNASADGGADLVERDHRWVRSIRSSFNRGFAGGNNEAVRRSPPADFILLLNPDTEIYPDCLSRLAEAFAANPKLGVAGCKMHEADRTTLQHLGGFLGPNGLPSHAGEGAKDDGRRRGLLPCDYVQGAAMAVRREVWEALGGLDEGFNPAYFEEADFCARARKAGWIVAVAGEAGLVHHQDPKSQVQSRTFLKLLFRGRARYLVKHYSPREWLLRYLPAEIRWLASAGSKGYRRIALAALWNAWTGTPDEFS